MRLTRRLFFGASVFLALPACDGVVQPLQRAPWVAQPPRAEASGGSAGLPAGDESVTLAVSSIVKQRCTPCHSAAPTMGTAAPGGVMFDTSDQIMAKKDRIKIRTLDLKNMPLLNKTQMTDDERAVIGRWLDALSKSG